MSRLLAAMLTATLTAMLPSAVVLTVLVGGTAATVQPAHAIYRCCRMDCTKWERAPGSIGARCVSQKRKCFGTVSKHACHGRHPN
jgi:hypothetical protein